VKHRAADSREALLAAATDEFALHGFDGTSVDTIARRAGVNKAMIYYHFKSKERLYLEVLGGVFTAIGDRTEAIARSQASAPEKAAAFLRAISAEADANPYLPVMMMREVAEGARRLDAPTLRLMSRIFFSLQPILEQGVREGVFRPTHPVLAYFSFISPIFFFRAARPVRAAMEHHKILQGVEHIDDEVFLEHVTTNLLHALAADPAPAPKRGGRRPATARQPRTGDHA
jgi:AcrR family transcriptional regulator